MPNIATPRLTTKAECLARNNQPINLMDSVEDAMRRVFGSIPHDMTHGAIAEPSIDLVDRTPVIYRHMA